MIPILGKFEPNLKIIGHPEHWGVMSNRWSKKSSKFEQDAKRKASGQSIPVPGPVPQREWNCRFCKKECGTKGDFTDHLSKTHWSENGYSRV